MADRYFIPFPGKVEVLIFDRIIGCGNDNKAVASCDDSDMAHRIVDLLNADEKNKALPARAGGKWVTSRKDTE